MKRKLWKTLLATLAVLAAAGALILTWGYYTGRFLYIQGSFYRRDAKTLTATEDMAEELDRLTEFTSLEKLDLRRCVVTAEEFEQLQLAMPDCEILWLVPFQDGYVDSQTRGLEVLFLGQEDVKQLEYLTELEYVTAVDCDDQTWFVELQKQRPELEVFYTVTLSEVLWGSDSTELTLEDADAAVLEEKLQYLPKTENVVLTGDLPGAAEIQALQETYPQITFTWQMEKDGAYLDMNTTAFDLSGAASLAEVEEVLFYFPKLQFLDLRGNTIPDEELVLLAKKNPGVDLLWDLTVGQTTVSTGAKEIYLSGTDVSVEEVEAVLHCFPELQRVEMCDCPVTTEEMAALWKRYPDIRFVWTVDLAGMPHRTDADYFMPNKYGLKINDSNIADLRYCVDMICVDVGHGTEVTHCEWAAYMPKLKYLVLADSGVRSVEPLRGLEELVFLELFQSRVKDYSPLQECPALEDLNLCYTYGDPAPVQEMTWLKRLWWSGCRWNRRKELTAALADTQIEFSARSSTGNGWREGQRYYEMRDVVGMGYMTG